MCYTTLDMAALIGGRVFLGAGAGWMNKEFGVLGAPFQRRVSAWTGISEL
jgi:alkanesulfonate monooxygenase SsuD/methylene tetrahydromethanopterin reductase-like flavin-dependent oxidoreductase (luciferase family)